MVPGQILIEVLVALAISSMLSLILFTTSSQISSGVASTFARIVRNDRFMLFYRQWDRDLAGAFIPLIAKTKEEEKKTEEKKTPAGEEKKEEAPTKPGQQKLEPLEKSFVLQSAEKNLKLFTFITTNPLPTFGATKPRMVRVVYTLEPEPRRKDAYRLLRQELENIDPAEIEKKSTKSFAIIDGVKELTLELVAIVREKAQEAKPTTAEGAQKEKEGEVQEKEITVKEWPAKELAEKTLLPSYVIARLVLWDPTYKRDTTVTYRIPLFVRADVEKKEEQAPQGLPAKPEGKPGVTPPRTAAKPPVPLQPGVRR